MEPPKINKHQAKKSLAGKKSKKETIKNVLVKPTTDYWPELTPEDNASLEKVLNAILPRVRNEPVKIPYSQIKKIPKEQRKQARRSYQPETTETPKCVAGLVFGINDVSRCLEQDNCSCVILEKEVVPRLLIQHVIDLSVLHRVPVVVYTGLKQLLKDKVGIKSAAFAIKNTTESENSLNNIVTAVKSLSQSYEVPENHVHYQRHIGNSDTSSANPRPVEIDLTGKETPPESDVEMKTNYHLKRQSTTQRAFVPEKSSATNAVKADFSFLPFILDNPRETTTVSNVNSSRKSYKSLVVKRLKGDKNRNMRKNNNIKRRKVS